MPEEPMTTEAQRDELKTLCQKPGRARQVISLNWISVPSMIFSRWVLRSDFRPRQTVRLLS